MILDQHGDPMPAAAPVQQRAFSPWFATQSNPQRRKLWTFSGDADGWLSPMARTAIDEAAVTLYANCGLARALKPLSRIVGSLSPQARSGDEEWDALAELAWKRVTGSPMIFDAQGVRDISAMQEEAVEMGMVRGELFTVLTESPSGSARVAIRGAHAVGGVPKNGEVDRWRDGIYVNSDNFPIAYHFKGKRGRPGTVLGNRSVYHHAFRFMGSVRGVSTLAHALNNLRDLVEIAMAQKAAVKAAAHVAITRKGDTAAGQQPTPFGLSSPISSDPFAAPDVLAPEATEAVTPLGFEEYLATGLMSSVPLDVLHDERPHPNAIEFRRDLMREMAAGIGVPHQLLFFMDDPGGAWTRALMEALSKFVVSTQVQYLRPFCQRMWGYVIAKEMKGGRLPEPNGDPWKVKWTPPRSMTVDIGRMGTLTINMRRTMLTTFAAHYEELGLDWQDELRQGANELAYLKRLEMEVPGLSPGDLTAWTEVPPAANAAQDPAQQKTATQIKAEIEELTRQLAETATI